MIINKDEAKAMEEPVLCDFKYKPNSTTCNLQQKRNNRTYQCKCKNFHTCEKDYNWNPNTYICENSKHLLCHGFYIDKKGKYYSNKCYEHCFNKL